MVIVNIAMPDIIVAHRAVDALVYRLGSRWEGVALGLHRVCVGRGLILGCRASLKNVLVW